MFYVYEEKKKNGRETFEELEAESERCFEKFLRLAT